MVDVVGKFGSFVRDKRGPIEIVLIVLILIHYAPTEVLGRQLNSKVHSLMGPVLNPVQSIMSNVYMRLFLWLVLLWAAFSGKEMSLFFLVTIYFLVGG